MNYTNQAKTVTVEETMTLSLSKRIFNTYEYAFVAISMISLYITNL